MIGRVGVFLAAYILWLLLIFPYDPARTAAPGLSAWDWQGLLLGLGAALVAALLAPGRLRRDDCGADLAPGRGEGSSAKFLNPVRWFWAAVYVPVLLYYVLKANLQVAYLVLHPDLPISPGTVRVRTSLSSSSGRTALANSITLTPGTLTVDVDDEEGVLYVHWLTVPVCCRTGREAEDDGEATRRIVSKFEPLLRRIFD